MYIMCLIIFEEKAEVQDQYPLSLNPDKKVDDPIQESYRSIGFQLRFEFFRFALERYFLEQLYVIVVNSF